MVRLWLDDKRPVPNLQWTLATTAREAIDCLKSEDVLELSLDHDLGHCSFCTECNGYKSACGCECHWSGMTVVIFMVTTGKWPRNRPNVHSQNPVGAENMRRTIDRYWPESKVALPLELGDVQVGEVGFRLEFSEQVKCDSFRNKHWGEHKSTPLRGLASVTCLFTPHEHWHEGRYPVRGLQGAPGRERLRIMVIEAMLVGAGMAAAYVVQLFTNPRPKKPPLPVTPSYCPHTWYETDSGLSMSCRRVRAQGCINGLCRHHCEQLGCGCFSL